MTQGEILEELKKLPITERLTIIDAVLQTIRKDLQQLPLPSVDADKKRQLAAAAEALRSDYAGDSELTAFTALDGEDFYA